MAMLLRQSTASQEILLGRFLDSTDGDSEEVSLSIANTDIKVFKHGATTLASKNSGGGTHIANGLYYAVLDATDTDTMGNLEVHVHVSGALAVKREFVVLDAVVFDSLVLATDKLQVDTREVGGTSQTARDLGASVLLSSGTGTGQLDFTSGVVKTNVTQFGGSAGTFASGVPEVKAASLGTTAKADVNAEVVDCLNVDTYAEVGQETPAATQTIRKMLAFMYRVWRNKKDFDRTTGVEQLYADDGTTVNQKRNAVTNTATVTTSPEVTTGP